MGNKEGRKMAIRLDRIEDDFVYSKFTYVPDYFELKGDRLFNANTGEYVDTEGKKYFYCGPGDVPKREIYRALCKKKLINDNQNCGELTREELPGTRHYQTYQAIMPNGKFDKEILYGEAYLEMEKAQEEFKDLISQKGKSEKWKRIITESDGDGRSYSRFYYHDQVLDCDLEIEYGILIF